MPVANAVHDVYYDRYGEAFTPARGDMCREREGIFAVCVANDCVLVMAPDHSPNVPELPGGGIEEGESAREALVREIAEETGVLVTGGNVPEATDYQQRVAFYATNQNEFWDYAQDYVVLKGAVIEGLYFEGKQETPENGLAWWMPLTDLKEGAFHHMHKQAIEGLIKQGAI